QQVEDAPALLLAAHHDVQDDQVGLRLLHELVGAVPLLADQHLVRALLAQQRLHQLQEHCVVVDHGHARANPAHARPWAGTGPGGRLPGGSRSSEARADAAAWPAGFYPAADAPLPDAAPAGASCTISSLK